MGHHTQTGEPACTEIDTVNPITGAVNVAVATRAAASDAIDAAVMTVAATTAQNADKKSVAVESIAAPVGSRSAWMSTTSTI